MTTEKHTCAATVNRGSLLFTPCERRATLEHDGRHYCAAHHPPTVAARKTAQDQAYRAEQDARHRQRLEFEAREAERHRRAGHFDHLLAAAKLGLSLAESAIKSEYEGTARFKQAMAELEPVRQAIAAAETTQGENSV